MITFFNLLCLPNQVPFFRKKFFMIARVSKSFIYLFCWFSASLSVHAQQNISLPDAVKTAKENYGSIKAKAKYAAASQAAADYTRSEYLPNLNLSAQWDYGTVNGQIGPAYGFGGLGVASSGLPSASQNWRAAFGAIYLTNVNWDFFAFGRVKQKIKTSESIAVRDEKDLEQEIFQHTIKVSAAYLNLLVAQKLRASLEKNLERAQAIGLVVTTRARTGLVPGVDSSLANAEISNARIAITRALDFEQERSNQLSVLMGVAPETLTLDSLFVTSIPAGLQTPAGQVNDTHPTLQYYKSRIRVSEQQHQYLKTFYYPTFSMVGVFQTRGSGFGSAYAANPTDYTHSILTGFNPVRSNFLFGLGVTWNLTQPLRYAHQVKSQDLISRALLDEYQLAAQQLDAQAALAETKIKNALDNYREAPLQVKAASDAYLQKTVMYRNGLVNLVDLNQTLYALIRAETDRDIANNNVWQALLLKAAASGDYSVFENAF